MTKPQTVVSRRNRKFSNRFYLGANVRFLECPAIGVAWIRQGSSPHNARSLPRRCRQAAAEAEGKTEGPHSSRANNCPQCANKTTAPEARGCPKGQVPCARSGQPGTLRG